VDRDQLLLELGHHALRGERQDSFALSAADQFRQKDTDLDCLAKGYRVREQGTMPDLP